jgi:hypothetical protein
MNVPIRMLGIATSIFWIILIGYFASAAYSFKDLNFNFGEPQFTTTPTNDLMFSLPVYIDNRGYYSLKEFNLTTVFLDMEGAELSNASTFVPIIPHGQNLTIIHNVTLSTASLTEKEQYLFNDSSLNLMVEAGLNFAELLPTQLSMNVTYPWGAPFYDFSLGQPKFTSLDLSHVGVSASMSFENHAAYNLVGNISIELCDVAGSVLTQTQIPLDVAKQTSYAKMVEFNVPFDAASPLAKPSGYFNVYFSTSMFDYGPLVIPYG